MNGESEGRLIRTDPFPAGLCCSESHMYMLAEGLEGGRNFARDIEQLRAAKELR